MAFLRGVTDLPPGWGGAQIKLVLANVATNTGNTNVSLPASGSFSSPVSAAIIRVKSLTVGVNATVKVAAIIGTDAGNASNLIQVYGGDGSASPAGVGIDESFSIRSDVSFGSINVVVNVATNNCTHDVSIAANPPQAVNE
jgi:hypothetical protein